MAYRGSAGQNMGFSRADHMGSSWQKIGVSMANCKGQQGRLEGVSRAEKRDSAGQSTGGQQGRLQGIRWTDYRGLVGTLDKERAHYIRAGHKWSQMAQDRVYLLPRLCKFLYCRLQKLGRAFYRTIQYNKFPNIFTC